MQKNENDYTYYITNVAPLYTIDIAGIKVDDAINYLMVEKIIKENLEPNYLGEWFTLSYL